MSTREFVFETESVVRSTKTYELILFIDKAEGKTEQDAIDTFLRTRNYKTDWYKVDFLEEDINPSVKKEKLSDCYED